MIIDTHCHLDDICYLQDLDEVIDRAKSAGVGGMIIPGANPADLPRARKICEKYDNLFFGVGVHPYYASEYDEELLLKFAAHPKCIAIGECGLDYYRLSDDEKTKQREIELQKNIFNLQIKLAIKLKKPLIVHIRESSKDSKEILISHDIQKVGGVLHCYNANEALVELCEFGFYFGIGGVVTFKNAKKLLDILPRIPVDKILLETDAPYLTPHPHRGERNEPSYTTLVLKKISEVLNLDETLLKRDILSNTKELFKQNSIKYPFKGVE